MSDQLYRVKPFIIIIGLFLIICASYHIRVSTWQLQEKKSGEKLIFTLESALLFRYASLSLDSAIPKIDKKIEYPDGVESYKCFSLGGCIASAYAYTFFKKYLHLNVDFEQFYRYSSPAFFVLISIPVIFWIGYMVSGNMLLCLLMALWYGVCIPSVIRSTGQEFMGENFALPFIFSHVAFFISGIKTNNKYMFFISGLLLSIAWYLWDMTHLYMYVLAIFFIFHSFHWKNVSALIIPLIITAVCNPYLRFHHAYFSVPVLFISGLSAIEWCVSKYKIQRYAFGIRVCLAGLVLLISTATGYADDYSHFYDLFIAKLSFKNIKPIDPNLIPMDVRILWTPALHSASVYNVLKYFSCIFLTGLVSIIVLLSKRNRVQLSEKYIIWCFLLFSVLYILFVRIHVYTAFFGILTVVLFNHIELRKWRIASLAVFFLVTAGEYERTLAYREYMGRDEDYSSLKSLVQWINKNTESESPVLASFNLAGPIVYYTNRPVIVQPKFEKKKTREIYKDFLTFLFVPSETSFYEFARKHDARYFVYEKGTSWSRSIYSPAYFVALSSKRIKDTLAWRFEGDTRSLYKFWPVYENSMYRVFKILTPEDETAANDLFKKAEIRYKEGNYATAEQWYRKSLDIFPCFRKAHMRLGTLLWYQDKKNEARAQWLRGKHIDQNSYSMNKT